MFSACLVQVKNTYNLNWFLCCRWINSVDTNDMLENDHMIVPRIPAGVSGTALAASLLRDGWSVSYMLNYVGGLISLIWFENSSLIAYVHFTRLFFNSLLKCMQSTKKPLMQWGTSSWVGRNLRQYCNGYAFNNSMFFLYIYSLNTVLQRVCLLLYISLSSTYVCSWW